jgi:hypothetical protein
MERAENLNWMIQSIHIQFRIGILDSRVTFARRKRNIRRILPSEEIVVDEELEGLVLPYSGLPR